MQNESGAGCLGLILLLVIGGCVWHNVDKAHQHHEEVAAVAEGAADDADALKKRVEELESKVSSDETEIEELKSEVNALRNRVQ